MNRIPCLKVLDVGLPILLVDKPRLGYEAIGITQGGAADQHSFIWANVLCGNPCLLPGLEVVGQQLTIEILSDCILAVTGAARQVNINQKNQNAWQSFQLTKGDKLSLSTIEGLRSYIAISGGIGAEPIFGSATAVVRDGLGGVDGDGHPITQGQVLKCQNLGNRVTPKQAPEKAIPVRQKTLTLRVVEGYQAAKFSRAQRIQFSTSTYRLSAQSNRMAAQFEGRAIATPNSQMYSEGICRGALQVPPSGRPIVMLDDRQTVGGYPKLGSVISIDCDRLSQAAPNTEVCFEWIDFHKGTNLLHLYRELQRRLMASINVNFSF